MTTQSAAAEQTATPSENEAERKSVVDDFAGYRALRRRLQDPKPCWLIDHLDKLVCFAKQMQPR